MGSGAGQGGAGGSQMGAQMGSGYGMPGGGIASMMGGMSPGMGGGMFGGPQVKPSMGTYFGGQGPQGNGRRFDFEGGGTGMGPQRGQYGQPGGGFMGGGGYAPQDAVGGRGSSADPRSPYFSGPGGFDRSGPPGSLDLPRDPRTGAPVGALVSKPIGPGDGPFGFGGNRPGNMGGQGGGITQFFNPGGGGATQQGQSQMILDGQYPGMQGQPGGRRNTLPYFPGSPPMQGQPGDRRNTLPYSPGGPGMGQFGAL